MELKFTKDLLQGERFDIGDFSYGEIEVLGRSGRVIVGRYCSIAEDVVAVMADHRMDWITTYPFSTICKEWPETKAAGGETAERGDLVIGNDVWIGHDVLLLAGITIGHGAVIGAGAVVAKDIPPYAVAVGNPVRVIRMRFPDDDIKRLLAIKWWDWPLAMVQKHVAVLQSGRIDELEHIARDEGLMEP